MRRSGGDKFYADNFDKQRTSLFGFQAVRDFPICNHTQCLSKYDVGYCQAILCDGMPFEAELYKSESGMGLAVIMPVMDEETAALYDDACVHSPNTNVIGMKLTDQLQDYSNFDMGMVDEGEVYDELTIHRYVNYLVGNGVVRFTTGMYNGAGWYRTDVAGNALIKIVITLSERGQVVAETDLKFRKFPYSQSGSGSTGKIVEFPNRG